MGYALHETLQIGDARDARAKITLDILQIGEYNLVMTSARFKIKASAARRQWNCTASSLIPSGIERAVPVVVSHTLAGVKAITGATRPASGGIE